MQQHSTTQCLYCKQHTALLAQQLTLPTFRTQANALLERHISIDIRLCQCLILTGAASCTAATCRHLTYVLHCASAHMRRLVTRSAVLLAFCARVCSRVCSRTLDPGRATTRPSSQVPPQTPLNSHHTLTCAAFCTAATCHRLTVGAQESAAAAGPPQALCHRHRPSFHASVKPRLFGSVFTPREGAGGGGEGHSTSIHATDPLGCPDTNPPAQPPVQQPLVVI